MKKNFKFQNRLIAAVSLVLMMMMAGAIIWMTAHEERVYQKNALDDIYVKANSMARRLGQMMHSSSWRNIMVTLSLDKKNDLNLICFYVTDTDGRIMVSDRASTVNTRGSDYVLRTPQSRDLLMTRSFSASADGDAAFKVYKNRLVQDLHDAGRSRHRAGEMVFDTFHDIWYMGTKIGELRLGYSRQNLVAQIDRLKLRLVCAGLAFLAVIMILIFVVVKRSMAPLEVFTEKMSDLGRAAGGEAVRHSLDQIHLDDFSVSIYEIEQLKAAFSKMRSSLVQSWDHLEENKNNLEKMVLERTRELEHANRNLEVQIRERQEIEARMLHAQKLESVGTLAGGVAHDFNNLLMAIQGNVSLMRHILEPQHPLQTKVDKILSLVDMGADVVRQLLGFARGGQGRVELLNFNVFLESNRLFFQKAVKPVEIVLNLDNKPEMIKADYPQMTQVLINIIINGAEAMGGKGSINITTGNVLLTKQELLPYGLDPGLFVMVSVEDSGCGMDGATLKRVFDPFFTTKNMDRGTGMGLASAYGIVRNHGGFVRLESQPGRGTTVFVYLPVMAGEVLDG